MEIFAGVDGTGVGGVALLAVLDAAGVVGLVGVGDVGLGAKVHPAISIDAVMIRRIEVTSNFPVIQFFH